MSVFVKTQTKKYFTVMVRIYILKVTTERVRHNQLLLNQFQAIPHLKVEGAQLADKAVLSVYTEFSRKL